MFLEFLAFVTSFPGVTYHPIHYMEGWEWTGFQRATTGWTLPNYKWRALTLIAGSEHLKRRWNCQLVGQKWNKFWIGLWKGKAQP
jgi:hypothetical protein